MTVALVNEGGLFKRLGLLASMARDLVALKGGTATTNVGAGASLSTRGTSVESFAAESPAVSDQVDNSWQAIEALRSGTSGFFAQLRQWAERITVRMADLDASLPSKDLTTALKELIAQMTGPDFGDPVNDIKASLTSLGEQTNGTPAPTGTPKIVVSGTNARGQAWQTVFSETIRVRCETDAQNGGSATARQEQLSFKGAAAVNDPFDHRYPAGSGCSISVNLIDAELDNSGGNKLYNSSFEQFTSTNYPVDWIVATGTAGTQVFQAGESDAQTGDNALKLTGASDVETAVTQTFDTTHSTTQAAGGTPYEILPQTQYAVCLFVKCLTAPPAAGTLRVSLIDGNGAVINDDQGEQEFAQEDDFAIYLEDGSSALLLEASGNSFAIDLTQTTTSYVAYTGVFRTPSVLPAVVKIQLKTSPAITNGSSICIDNLAMGLMTPLYNGGPSVAAFAGATNPVVGDTWTLTNTCTRGILADWLERFFALRDKLLIIPFDTGDDETVPDTVVTAV